MALIKEIVKKITNYSNRNSIGSKLRAKRIAPLLRLIEKISKQNGCVNIIDIGGTEEYWTIVPLYFFEKHKVRLTVVNLQQVQTNNNRYFEFVYADGCNLSEFQDNSFHIAHSNSVIEHVGDWDQMLKFSQELKRISKSYFIQTPNFWFPIEPHSMAPFFHWFPKPIRIWIVMRFSLGYWKKAESVSEAVSIVESARLLNKKMFFELFNDSKLLTEKIAFLPKSFVAIRNNSG